MEWPARAPRQLGRQLHHTRPSDWPDFCSAPHFFSGPRSFLPPLRPRARCWLERVANGQSRAVARRRRLDSRGDRDRSATRDDEVEPSHPPTGRHHGIFLSFLRRFQHNSSSFPPSAFPRGAAVTACAEMGRNISPPPRRAPTASSAGPAPPAAAGPRPGDAVAIIGLMAADGGRRRASRFTTSFEDIGAAAEGAAGRQEGFRRLSSNGATASRRWKRKSGKGAAERRRGASTGWWREGARAKEKLGAADPVFCRVPQSTRGRGGVHEGVHNWTEYEMPKPHAWGSARALGAIQ